MSQHWHGNQTEDAFMPTRLRNWEVPNWHPKWPDRHCTITTFQADNNGRILEGFKKYMRPPTTYTKGTWTLPKKIDRKLANELSAPCQHKKTLWELHKARNLTICQRFDISQKKRKNHLMSKEEQLAVLKKEEEKREQNQMAFLMRDAKPVSSIHRSKQNGVIVTRFL